MHLDIKMNGYRVDVSETVTHKILGTVSLWTSIDLHF